MELAAIADGAIINRQSRKYCFTVFIFRYLFSDRQLHCQSLSPRLQCRNLPGQTDYERDLGIADLDNPLVAVDIVVAGIVVVGIAADIGPQIVEF